ncbi:MAG: LON peptidase substrate-binding domain-containing protein [Phycisphaerales bacterium]
MSEEETEIRVNFGRPMPLFPLPSVALMPHAVLPLHIFEPRYRKMVADALDGPGQIAMAMYDLERMKGAGSRAEGRGEESEPERPPLRQAVCVGQVVQHHKLGDGRYTIALHGVCRAKIITELPEESDVPYRQALLEPIGLDDGDPETMAAARETLAGLLEAQPLAGLREAEAVGRHLRDDEIPATAVLELVAVTLLRDSEMRFYNELHYQLLAEGDPQRRARMIEERLRELSTLLTRALPQTTTDAPKGCHWN